MCPARCCCHSCYACCCQTAAASAPAVPTTTTTATPWHTWQRAQVAARVCHARLRLSTPSPFPQFPAIHCAIFYLHFPFFLSLSRCLSSLAVCLAISFYCWILFTPACCLLLLYSCVGICFRRRLWPRLPSCICSWSWSCPAAAWVLLFAFLFTFLFHFSNEL